MRGIRNETAISLPYSPDAPPSLTNRLTLQNPRRAGLGACLVAGALCLAGLSATAAHAQSPKEQDRAAPRFRSDRLTALEDATIREPHDVATHMELAKALVDLNRVDDALAVVTKAAELNPVAAEPHIGIADIMNSRHQRGVAFAEYGKAIKLNPKAMAAGFRRSRMLLEMGWVEESRIELGRQNEQKFSWRVWLFAKFGMDLTSEGMQSKVFGQHADLSGAETIFRQAVQLNPRDQLMQYCLGISLTEQRKPDEAVTALRAAAELQPNFANTYPWLGKALLQTPHPEAAIAAFQQALRLDSNMPVTHTGLGMAYLALGQDDDAERELRTSISLAGKDPGPHYLLASLLRKPERRARDNAAILNKILVAVGIRSEQQSLEDAVSEYRAALEISPRDAVRRIEMALMLVELGRSDEAMTAFQQSVDGPPKSGHAGGMFALARAMMSARPPEQDVDTPLPEVIGAYLSLATVLRDRRREEDANKILAVAQRMDPRNAKVRAAMERSRPDALSH